MDARAGMLAGLFARLMGPGPEWRVEGVLLELPESGDEELHVRVGRVLGAAVFGNVWLEDLSITGFRE